MIKLKQNTWCKLILPLNAQKKQRDFWFVVFFFFQAPRKVLGPPMKNVCGVFDDGIGFLEGDRKFQEVSMWKYYFQGVTINYHLFSV